MKKNEDIIEQFHKHYKITKSGLSNQYKEIQECRSFYNGNYMDYRDTLSFGSGRSKSVQEVSFNQVKPYVNAFVGFFIQNRRSAIYVSKVNDDNARKVQTDYINSYYKYCRENCQADQIETKQDFDLAIGGVGVVDTAISSKDGTPSRLPGGEIIKERVDPLQCGWDPLDESPNLIYSKWAWRAKDYDLPEALELFDADEDDFEYTNTSDDINNYKRIPNGGIQDKYAFEYSNPERTQVKVYFYQWYEIENYYRIENPLLKQFDEILQLALFRAFEGVDQNEEDEVFAFDPTASILTVTKSVRSKVKEIFDVFDIPWNPLTEKRKVFYTALVSGDKVLQKFKSISQQGFSLKFKTGDRDYGSGMYTGIVSSMKQPQRYFNKSLTEFMYILASNAKGGVIAQKGAIGNIQEFEAKYARNNSVVEVEDLNGVRDKAKPQMTTGYEFVMQQSGESFSKVTGINETFFGINASGNETAILQRQRVKQATTLLSPYVDSVTLYMKEDARMMLSYMRMLNDLNEGDSFLVDSDDGRKNLQPISQKYLSDEYLIAISEAPETDAQRDYYANVLISLAQSFLSVGDVKTASSVYTIAIDQLPIDQKDKIKLSEALNGQQAPDPAMVAQMKAQLDKATSDRAMLENQKIATDIQKGRAEVEKVIAGIRTSQFENAESIEDIERKAIENDLLSVKPMQEIDVNI